MIYFFDGGVFTPVTDPDFASVVLLLGFEGADASTTFTDESPSPKTMTAVGNAQIDTAQFKYGSASGLFDGTGDSVSTPDAAAFTLGTSDFTMECWVRFGALGATSRTFFSQWGAVASPASRTFLWYASGTAQSFSYNQTQTFNSAWTPSINIWYHLAICRDGANLRMFVDGTQVGSTHNIAATSIVDSTSVAHVGSNGGTASFVNGHLDEMRITIGVARYTANFTPPSAAFPRS